MKPGLQVEITVDDPATFTTPWSGFVTYRHVWASGRKPCAPKTRRGPARHGLSWCLRPISRTSEGWHGDLAPWAANGMVRPCSAEAFCYGADLVYVVADDLLADYRNEPYTKAMTDLVNTYKPEILLLGATTLGRDLAGSVATTLLTGLTADCTELAVDGDSSLAATRPTFGGSLMCTIYTLNYRPQMATVRPRVMAMPERLEKAPNRIIEHDLGMAEFDIVTKVLAFLPDRDSAKSSQ
jgi:electron transfer flavoprotein alpha subunit